MVFATRNWLTKQCLLILVLSTDIVICHIALCVVLCGGRPCPDDFVHRIATVGEVGAKNHECSAVAVGHTGELLELTVASGHHLPLEVVPIAPDVQRVVVAYASGGCHSRLLKRPCRRLYGHGHQDVA